MYGSRVLPTPTTAVMRPTRMMKQAPSFVSHANLPLAVRSRMHAGKSHPMATAAMAPVIVCTEQHRLKLLGAEEQRYLPHAHLLVHEW